MPRAKGMTAGYMSVAGKDCSRCTDESHPHRRPQIPQKAGRYLAEVFGSDLRKMQLGCHFEDASFVNQPLEAGGHHYNFTAALIAKEG